MLGAACEIKCIHALGRFKWNLGVVLYQLQQLVMPLQLGTSRQDLEFVVIHVTNVFTHHHIDNLFAQIL